jgi:hypothetical protein
MPAGGFHGEAWRLQALLCCQSSESVLANLGAAALNENAEHNDEKHGANDPDNCCLVHFESPFPKISETCVTNPWGLRGWLAEHMQNKSPPEDLHRRRLVHLGATALNENAEHNDKQYAGDNPDNRYLVHTDPPFLRC